MKVFCIILQHLFFCPFGWIEMDTHIPFFYFFKQMICIINVVMQHWHVLLLLWRLQGLRREQKLAGNMEILFRMRSHYTLGCVMRPQCFTFYEVIISKNLVGYRGQRSVNGWLTSCSGSGRFTAGSSATLLSSFGCLLGFTEGDYHNPRGNVPPFIQVLRKPWLSVVTFTSSDFFPLFWITALHHVYTQTKTDEVNRA